MCDSAAAEQCPYWPGSPVKTHWGYPDPSNEVEENKPRAFELTRQAIGFKMMQLIQLPLSTMSTAELNAALAAIAQQHMAGWPTEAPDRAAGPLRRERALALGARD